MTEVRTCLWFERDAASAVEFYTSLIPGSFAERPVYAPAPWPGGTAGEALVIDFSLAGQEFQAVNGGSKEAYGLAASISVTCETQEEIDRLWSELISGGGAPRQCGWLTDRWGVPWKIVPAVLPRLLRNLDRAVAARTFAAMTKMVKLDIRALEAASSL